MYDLATEKAEALVDKALSRGIDACVVHDVDQAAAESDIRGNPDARALVRPQQTTDRCPRRRAGRR